MTLLLLEWATALLAIPSFWLNTVPEQAAREKGKWSSDLSNYAHLNADELHSGFLNRLHSNRDYEASLVNLMKERYEVNSSPLFIDL